MPRAMSRPSQAQPHLVQRCHLYEDVGGCLEQLRVMRLRAGREWGRGQVATAEELGATHRAWGVCAPATPPKTMPDSNTPVQPSFRPAAAPLPHVAPP